MIREKYLTFCSFQDAFPRKLYNDPSKWKLLKVVTFLSLKDVLDFHTSQHPSAPAPSSLDISMDGVPESKMNSKTMEVVSCRFENCRKVYPLRIGIAERDAKKLTSEVS